MMIEATPGTLRGMVIAVSVSLTLSVPAISASEHQAENVKRSMALLGPPAADAPALNGLTAVVEFDARQADRSRGVELKVTISNSTDQRVEILDPLDTTSTLLLTEDGWPVQHPVPVPRAFINTAADGDPSTRKQTQIVLLAPGESYLVQISIRQMTGILKRSAPSQSRSDESATVTPLTPGTYTVQVASVLISGRPNAVGTRAMRRLESPRFEVRFGG
jgi:hypothetical protein